jgi:ABC-type phosphate transport system auxiliary subunit
MFDEFRSCHKRLQFFDNLIDQITQKIGMPDHLTDTERDDARKLMRELKGELKKDCLFMKDDNVQESLSDIDKYFYYPTIQKALSCIKVGVNSMPCQKWVGQLYEAKAEIRQGIDEVSNYL